MMVKKQQVHPLEALKRSEDCWKVSTGDDELEGEEWVKMIFWRSPKE